jgi:carbonic anhydrase
MPTPTMVWTYRSTISTTTTLLSRSSGPKRNRRGLRQSGGLLALPLSLPLSCIFLQLIDVRRRSLLSFELTEQRSLPKIAGMRKTQLVSFFIVASLLVASHFARAADAHADQPSVAPAEAILKLKEGNGRYTSGNLQHPGQTTERRTELAKSQYPFAAIVSCSDSRVPPEIVFDQGLGDLFIVRVAGNVINDEGLGSIEYAVDHLGTRLILVLGHQRCGAVQAAKETIAAKGKAPGHIESLVTAIKPAVEATAKDDLETTIKANVKNVVQALRSSRPILKAGVDSGKIQVIGGYYVLDTGAVTFLDEK